MATPNVFMYVFWRVRQFVFRWSVGALLPSAPTTRRLRSAGKHLPRLAYRASGAPSGIWCSTALLRARIRYSIQVFGTSFAAVFGAMTCVSIEVRAFCESGNIQPVDGFQMGHSDAHPTRESQVYEAQRSEIIRLQADLSVISAIQSLGQFFSC